MVFSDFNHTGKAFPFSIPSRYQFTQNILHSRFFCPLIMFNLNFTIYQILKKSPADEVFTCG
ncbi:hypothetical protein EFM18_06525 [Limosilactobacillus fermentum]|nr:hypothetical protein [Limosilactobacillus fermentum]